MDSNLLPRDKAPPVIIDLPCSLEDLYTGAEKEWPVRKTALTPSGEPAETMDEILTFNIEPGQKNGDKIIFYNKGNQPPGFNVPGDVIFVIHEQPHAVYKRNEIDLVINHKLSLLEALTGMTLNLKRLDGVNHLISIADIIRPGHEMVIENEGMPCRRQPETKGDLTIKFDEEFPSKLNAVQKSGLRNVLGWRDNVLRVQNQGWFSIEMSRSCKQNWI